MYAIASLNNLKLLVFLTVNNVGIKFGEAVIASISYTNSCKLYRNLLDSLNFNSIKFLSFTVHDLLNYVQQSNTSTSMQYTELEICFTLPLLSTLQ